MTFDPNEVSRKILSATPVSPVAVELDIKPHEPHVVIRRLKSIFPGYDFSITGKKLTVIRKGETQDGQKNFNLAGN